MKTIQYFQFAILGLVFATAGCKKDKDSEPDTFAADQQVAVDGNRADHESEDVSGLEDDIMSKSDISFARTATEGDTNFSYDCATVTLVRRGSNPTGKLTVDFGTGCVGSDGRTRKGIIEWTFTDRLRNPNAIISTTFKDYGVRKNSSDNYVMVDNASTKKTTNMNEVASTTSIVLKREIDMKLNFTDGTSFSHKGTKNIVLTQLSGDRWTRVHTVLAGSQQNGTDRKGRNYVMSVSKDLVRKGECAKLGFYKPVSGILTITNDNKTKSIDFGNGDCDGEVTVTINGKIRRTRW